MSITLEFDYCRGEEADQYSFYRIPKALFTNARLRELSAEAKILYGLMLDRMGLSARNGWLDAAGRVYIYFTLDDAMDMMGFGHNKVVRLFRELEAIGLIERKKQGQGRPAVIYVKNFILPREDGETSENGKSEPPAGADPVDAESAGDGTEAPCEEAKTSQNGNSALPQTGGLDFQKEAGNKNNINKTKKSDTEYPIYPPAPLTRGETRSRGNGEDRMRRMEEYREQIREHIDYGSLQATHPCDMERIDGYVELMAEVCCSGKSTVRINQEDMPVEQARDRFLSLDREHILYVLECMDKTASQIGNIRAYVLSALYNAPATMEQYYAALVNRDFTQE